MKPRRHWLGRPHGLLVALLPLALLVTPAAAEEYKLVLTPEAGQAPPARVCLISRNQQMKAGQASGLVGALAKRVTCNGRACEAHRDTRPVRCKRCPETAHPGCAAALDLGERTPEEYSVVCADDDTRPPEGGTVYISVESVEAENPPQFYSLEVSGGRVRWSPIEAISRPSYRVLGGDFESSRFSYPRVATDQPWAEVPVLRRCRCLEAQVGRGVGAVGEARVDGTATCRGEVAGSGLLPVEVPAVGVDRVVALSVTGARGDSGARWASRWPTVPIEMLPDRFEFDWILPCVWPRAEVCPVATIQGANCTVGAPDGDVCSYDCRVIADQSVSPPVALHLHLDDPALDVEGILGAVGQRIVGRLPAAERVVWADVGDWHHRTPGDRIQAIDVVGLDGTRLTVELDAVEGDRITLPLHGARCGASVRTEFVGERDYDPGFGRIQPGARLELPHPDDLGVPWTMIFGAGGGAAMIVAVEADRQTQASLSYAFTANIGARLRARAASWFVEPQLLALVVADWPYTPLTADGGGNVVKRHLYSSAAAEVQFGWTTVLGGRTFHWRGGGGAGVGLDPWFDDNAVVEQGRGMGTWSLGMDTPLSGSMDSPFGLRLELRHWFGSRTLHFTVNEWTAVAKQAEPANVLMFNVLLTLTP